VSSGGVRPLYSVGPRKLAEEVIAQIFFGDKSACLTVDCHQSATIYFPMERNRQRLVRAAREQTPYLDVAASLRMEYETKRIENSQNILAR
jgi:hypothetical protein